MLTRKQYRKLLNIRRHDGTTGQDYSDNKALYDYLFRNNYLAKANIDGYTGAVITEDGELAIYRYRTERFRFWLPVCISIFAAIGAYREEIACIARVAKHLLQSMFSS